MASTCAQRYGDIGEEGKMTLRRREESRKKTCSERQKSILYLVKDLADKEGHTYSMLHVIAYPTLARR